MRWAAAVVVIVLALPALVADPGGATLPALLPHPPILVVGAGPLVVGDGIRGGSGTAADPYRISGWEIDLHRTSLDAGLVAAYAVRDAITIRDTSAHVLVTGNVIRGAPGDAIRVENAVNVRVENNRIDVDSDHLAIDHKTGARPAGIHFRAASGAIRDNAITVLDVGHKAAVGIHVELSTAVVSGNVVTNHATLLSFEGVLVEGGAGSTVSDNAIVDVGASASSWGLRGRSCRATFTANDVTGPGAGIELSACTFSAVEGNRLLAGSRGVHLRDGSGNRVRDNVVSAAERGLVLERERSGVVTGNRLDGNRYGFGVLGSDGVHFGHLVDATNLVDARPVRWLAGLRNAVVDGRTLGPTGFLGIVDAVNVVVHNVTLSGSVQGLLLANVRDLRAADLRLEGNWRGLDLAACQQSSATRVVASGAAVSGGSGCRLEHATLTRGGESVAPPLGAVGPYALRIVGSTFTTIANARISAAPNGVSVVSATDARVEATVFEGNGIGLVAEYPTRLRVVGSSFVGNSGALAATGGTTDARDSWWGSASGPPIGAAGVHGTQGASVLISPWLLAPPAGAGPAP